MMMNSLRATLTSATPLVFRVQELFAAQGQNCELRPPASGASRKFFDRPPLDWLKMNIRAFPAVQMSRFSNYEAP